ncbi:tunicamycin resistance protein [bacterium]|nr:MAG: tunicamycin resistance protein [bacterium]
MIVFINGAFGAGKTTTAKRLQERLPNSLLYDPEEVGFMLRAILKPIEWSGDFQDYPEWRKLVPATAQALIEQRKRILIIPMTIWREDYFLEVTEGLRRVDTDFQHFCLTAPVEIIHERLKRRGEQQEGTWAFQQAYKCVEAFESDIFDERIDSVGADTDQIVGHILGRIEAIKRRRCV